MFSAETGAEVWFKLENLQHTGSFKLRGAANRLLTLTPEQQAAGCVTASSGNHGAAVAYAMAKLNIGGVIFVPEKTSSTKVDAIRSYGGDVRFFGTDGLDTELHAREYAEQNGMFSSALLAWERAGDEAGVERVRPLVPGIIDESEDADPLPISD